MPRSFVLQRSKLQDDFDFGEVEPLDFTLKFSNGRLLLNDLLFQSAQIESGFFSLDLPRIFLILSLCVLLVDLRLKFSSLPAFMHLLK